MVISTSAWWDRRRKRPWERKIPIRPGPPDTMLLDDALERFLDEWIVFKITRADDAGGNDEGVVVAHGGPEKPMQEIASRLLEDDQEAQVAVRYCSGRPFRTIEEARRALAAWTDEDYQRWCDEWR